MARTSFSIPCWVFLCYSIHLWRTAAGLFGHRHGSLAKANCFRDSRLTAIGCPTSSYLLLAVETTNLAQLTIDFAETQRPTGNLENVSCHFMPFHAQKTLSVTASSSDSIATPLRLQAHGEDVQAVRLWGRYQLTGRTSFLTQVSLVVHRTG